MDGTIRERRSILGFEKNRPVEDSILRDALSLAQCAPSNCNVQPWRVFVAKGDVTRELRRALTAELDAGNFGEPEDPIDRFVGVYRDRQVECAQELYGHMGIARDDQAGRLRALRRNFELFDAPHIAIVCMEDSFGLGVALDVGMWVQTFMLALKARGVGSCAQAAMRHYPSIIREKLGIREDLRILCGVSFGYEDEDVAANQTVQSREPIEDNVVFIG